MRDRFEIVHLRPGGRVEVLQSHIPRDRRDRWTRTQELARLVLRAPIEKALIADGLTYAYRSIDFPQDGFVGIREKE